MKAPQKLGEYQKEVLKIANKRGKITYDQINNIYESRQGRKHGINSLIDRGLLEYVGLNQFKINRLPEWVREQLNEN